MTRLLRRTLVLTLLAAVALAPAVSRAHLRISTHPTPAQENARFKWSNSCEHVPTRLAHDTQIFQLPTALFAGVLDHPVRHDSWPAPDVPAVGSVSNQPPPLRAPPALAL